MEQNTPNLSVCGGGAIKIIFSEFITRFSLYLEKGVDSLFKKKKNNIKHIAF